MLPPTRDEIYEQLRARILRGDEGYRPGDRLPTQLELAKEFDVHRITIARVTLLLTADGLVASRGRRGTIVVERKSES
jgi:DNA-binding GntR family transcriptional regulator